MQSNYDQSLRWVLQHEGSYSDHKAEPGGATMRGITQLTYDAYRAGLGKPKQSVREIGDDEVQAIYREQYARPIWFNRLPAGVDYALFDFAVNSGVSRAVKTVQGIIGVRQDGIMGNQTLAAIASRDAGVLVQQLCGARLAFVRRLKTWSTFGRGWQKRIEQVQSRAVALAWRNELPPYENVPQSAAHKADGEQSLSGSIVSSRRSKAAVAGGAGMVLSAIPEALELAEPAKEVFAFGKYAAIIGMVITAAALAYIIWVRSREHD